MSTGSRHLSVFIVIALALGSLAGMAGAEAEDLTFTGCLKDNGKIDEIAVGDSPVRPCKQDGETQISWNSRGPAGADGEPGPQGDPGPQGEPGQAAFVGQRCAPETVLVGFDAAGDLLCERITTLTSPNGEFTVEVGDSGAAMSGPGSRILMSGGQIDVEASSSVRLNDNGNCLGAILGPYTFPIDEDEHGSFITLVPNTTAVCIGG